MGHKHTKDEILAGAVAVAFADGLGQLTFGRVAKHLDINDRTVVYYFPTKDDLVGEVVLSMGLELQQRLGEAFVEEAEDHRELARVAWPRLARPEVDPIFRLFFEANGLAIAGRAPCDTLVPHLVAAWVDWLMTFLAGPTAKRRAEAEATIAIIDGLLLLRLLRGPAAANRAAAQLGIT